MKNEEKYNWLVPIIEKHFQEMAKEILEEASIENGDISPNDLFRIGEIKEDLCITLANWLSWLEDTK